MNTKYARIPEIKSGLVFSDPSYDGDVWCQYRKDFQANNWLMKLDTRSDDGYIDIQLYLGRPTMVNTVTLEERSDGTLAIKHPTKYEIEFKELGIDTAQIFCGTKDEWDQFKEEASLYTGSDGFFGDLQVFTCKGEAEPAGFLLLASVDETFFNQSGLFQHFVSSFDAEKISEKHFQKLTSPASVEYMVIAASEQRHAEGSLVKDRNDIMDRSNGDRNI